LTVATYMVGGGKDQAAARLWVYWDPASFQALIDLLVETSIGYLRVRSKPATMGEIGSGYDPANGKI